MRFALFPDENEVTTSFLMQLSTWDKEELDEKLANRVQVSKRAVAKIVQVFDRMMQRNEKITIALKGESENGGEFFKSANQPASD
jgi:E3 ubiquitin-protein ligase BRE1